MALAPTVVIVGDDVDRRDEVIDALEPVTTDIVLTGTTADVLESLGPKGAFVRDDGTRSEPRSIDVFVVALADSKAIVASVERLRDRDPMAPVVVYGDSIPGSTIRELLAVDPIEYVPSDGSGANELLAARVRRATATRRDGATHRASLDAGPSMLDDVSEAVFSVNTDRHIVYCNRAAEGLLGRDRETVLGRRLDEIEAIDDTELERSLTRAMDASESVALETTIEGSVYDLRAYPSAAVLSVFARDVTERQERDRLFRAAFGGAMDAMLIADDDGRYVDANEAAVELFGVGRVADLLGRSIPDFAPDAYDVAAAWARFEASGRDRGLFPLVRSDGDRRVVEFAATRDVLEGRHLSVLRDVTDNDGYPSFESIVEEAKRGATGGNGASNGRCPTNANDG